MSDIKTAKTSPRLENGKFYWYEGDEFAIRLYINLTSNNGEVLGLIDGDEVKVSFYRNDLCIHKFTFNKFTDNSIMLNFSENVSKKFRKGTYSYLISYKHIGKTTIVANNEVEVE